MKGWKGRNEIAIRLVTLMRLAVRRRWLPPHRELARQLNVHPRTLRRDLAALRAAHALVAIDRRRAEALFEAETIDAQYVYVWADALAARQRS